MTRALAIWSLGASLAWAQASGHPPVQLLDQGGEPVQRSQQAVSTHRTCAPCHDVETIAAGYHAQLGNDEQGQPASSGRAADTGPGPIGRLDPLRLLAPLDPRDPARWLRENAWRHVGGGVGAPLGLEVDCFLCHTARPDRAARLEAVAAGRFADAPTATLRGSGLVAGEPGAWRWDAAAFGPGGQVRLPLEPARSEGCMACHALPGAPEGGAPLGSAEPERPDAVGDQGWIFSGQRLSASAFNLAGKDGLERAWDVHAERWVGCVDCHPPLNAPGSFEEGPASRPAHLAVSPRRPPVGEFLRAPSHDFRKGNASQGTVARRLNGSMRDCRACHAADAVHAAWLPFADRHLSALACQACHIPRVALPARQATDWSVPAPDGRPRVELRGVAGSPADAATLIAGWTPVLLERREADDQPTRLQPTQLHTVFYWVGGEPAAPVARETLAAALHADGAFRADVVAALDRDGDGALADDERWLDTPERVAFVRARLEATGVASPRLEGELLAQELHHGVAPGRDALRDCQACHTAEGRLGAPWELAAHAPAGVVPVPLADLRVELPGEVRRDGARLVYVPGGARHVVGHTRRGWVEGLGLGLLLLTGLGVGLHAALRARGGRG